MPFLAHTLGIFAGALLKALIAVNHKMKLALLIGLVFFIGRLMSVFILPSPTWFTILDLTIAYFPMAYFGGKIIELFKQSKPN